ncbi:MAG: bifunctional oligoribonuclease/PAP phosphatase NrnA [Spirochaetaceae bacterium]|nr:bifunctional oligoribonuclease/PAP phosphatase NrnA [Spirochaetaceae bacterium]
MAFIRDGAHFIVAGHKEPDGDCAGSQLALASALRRLGKTVTLASAGPWKRPEIIPYKALFQQEIAPHEASGARVIVVDCSMEERTGDLAPALRGLPTALIDHHASGAPYGEVCYLDAAAPSTTALVLALIHALGLTPTAEEAEWLFFGLATDTGFFRHVDSGGAEVFSVASSLVRFGASPKKVFGMINGGKTLNSRRLLARILARAEDHCNGKLVMSTEEFEDVQSAGGESRDSDTLYQLIQSVEGVEAIALLRQETADTCTVGLRSRDSVDVARIAAQFGGGGHKNAAGFLTQGCLKDVYPRVLAAFEEAFLPERAGC